MAVTKLDIGIIGNKIFSSKAQSQISNSVKCRFNQNVTVERFLKTFSFLYHNREQKNQKHIFKFTAATRL